LIYLPVAYSTSFWSGPDWLKNLFFTYSLVKQAISKAIPILEAGLFSTGDAEKDRITDVLLKKVIAVIKYGFYFICFSFSFLYLPFPLVSP
jgi:hypothetical protein